MSEYGISGHVGTGEIARAHDGNPFERLYRARCSCGWIGEWKFFAANADSQFGRHLGLVVRHPSITVWEPES